MPTRAPRWTRHTLAEGHGVGSGSPGLGCRRGIGWPWIPECPLQGGVGVGESGREPLPLWRPIPPARPDLARKQHHMTGAVFGGRCCQVVLRKTRATIGVKP